MVDYRDDLMKLGIALLCLACFSAALFIGDDPSYEAEQDTYLASKNRDSKIQENSARSQETLRYGQEHPESRRTVHEFASCANSLNPASSDCSERVAQSEDASSALFGYLMHLKRQMDKVLE